MKRLRWFDFLTINLFWLGLNIRNTVVGSFLTPYLAELYTSPNWKNTALSVMRNAGLIIAMLVQPAAGLISDRSTSRFGRRRPFIIIGVLLDLLFLAAIGISWSYWSLLVAVLLIQFSGNISHGPLQGLIPDLVLEDQRGRASAIKSIFELLPIILVGLAIAPLIANKQVGWAIVATGVGLTLTALLTLSWVKEKPLSEKPDVPLWPSLKRVLWMLAGILGGAGAGLIGGGLVGGIALGIAWSIAGIDAAIPIAIGVGGLIAMILAVVVGVWTGATLTIGKEASHHSSFIWWVVNRLLFLAAITSLQTFALYFFEYAFNIISEQAVDLLSKLLVSVGLFLLLSALPAGWLADRIGHKMLLGLSGIVAAIGGFLLLSTIWIPNISLIYVAGGILGLAAGSFMTINWSLGTNLVPPEEAGRFLGISNLAGAGAGMIGYGIGAPVADYLNGITPGLGYIATFAAYGVLFALSTLSLKFIREQHKISPFVG